MNGNAEHITEKPNSCEINVSAKGEVSFKVKAYGETLPEAREEAQKEYEKMVAYFEARKTGKAPALAVI